MKKTQKPSAKGSRERSGSRTLEIGFPFFVEAAAKRNYSQHLHKYFQKEKFFQGSRQVQWAPAEKTDASRLYGPTDLGLMGVTHVGTASYYARQGLLLPLESAFPDYTQYFLDAGWRRGISGGHLYSIPQHISIRVLFYRKDLLKKYGFEPPLTWMELEEQANAILQGEKDPDLNGILANLNPSICFSVFLDYIWTQGQDLYEKTGEWVLNRKALEGGLRQLSGFLEKGLMPHRVQAWDYAEPYQDFLKGHSVFLHHWTDGIQMIHELPETERDNFGWCPLPTFNLKIHSKAMVGGLSYVIPQDTRYPEAALKFLKLLFREDFQCWYAENLGSPYPSIKGVYLDGKVRRARPYLDQAEFFLRHGKLLEETPYFHGDYVDWVNIGGQELTLFLRGQQSLGDAVEKMEKRFAGLLPKPLFSGLTDQTVNYIQANLEKNLKVGHIAKLLKVSPEHLIRVFSQDTGQTPLQYINDAKMERAKALLKKGSLSVGEVAYSLGFKSRDHFSRLFHKLVKHTPNDYRK